MLAIQRRHFFRWNLHNSRRRRCFCAKIEYNGGLIEYIKCIWALMGPGLSAFLTFCTRCALYGRNASQSARNAFTFHSKLTFCMRSFRCCIILFFQFRSFRSGFRIRLVYSLSAGSHALHSVFTFEEWLMILNKSLPFRIYILKAYHLSTTMISRRAFIRIT